MRDSGKLLQMKRKFHLPGQFILGKTEDFVPEGWIIESSGSWILGRHPSLPRIRLLGNGDRTIGWILGYPIDGNGVLFGERDTIAVPWLSGWQESRVEQFVYGFGGRFLAVFVDSPRMRLYLDPCGSLSVVYSAHSQVVASTPNLIPYEDATRDQVDLIRDIGIPLTNAMYPLGLTPRFNIERLLPNHYLDLSDWKASRHWPKQPLRHEGSVDGAIAAVSTITKRNIAAVVSRYPAYLRLTAGGDSRMLLACARDVADRLELLTVPIQDEGAIIDVDIARKIAKRFRMRHFVPRFQEPKEEDLDEWMYRIGYSTGELRGWQAATMFKQANPAYAQLDGAIGALERGAWYIRGDTVSSRITPERLQSHCGGPGNAQTLARLQKWLETVPADNALQILDIFYLEQRLGCWGGVFPYSEGGNPGPVIFPMCHREVIERMLTLPLQYILSGFYLYELTHTGPPPFMQAIIEREWPELLAWPFNKPTGLMRLALAARRARRKLMYHLAR